MRTFAYFMLIVAILACFHNSLHADGGVGRKSYSEEQLAKEVEPIETLLNEIVNHTIKKQKNLQVQGRIVGKLNALARRAIKAEAENKDLLIKHGRLEYDVKQLTDVAKSLTCAKALKYGLEIFKIRILSDYEKNFQQRNRILKTIKEMLEKKRQCLTKIVIGIFQKTASMEKVVKYLNEMIACKSDYSVSMSPSNGAPEMNLTIALLQFHNVNESKNIKKIRAKQNAFWNNFDMTSDDTISEMKSFIAKFLYRPKVVMNDLLNTIDLQFDEQSYARQTLEVGRALRDEVGEQYNDCSWIMYISMQPEIQKIQDNLTVLRPHLDRGGKIDLFCYGFDALYKLLLLYNSEFYSPVSGLPKSCEPHSEDYIALINSIAVKSKNSNIALVALLYH